jgi:HlyD family secretion protein
VRAARAGLIATEPRAHSRLLAIRSPAQGKVMRILEKSERVLAAGTPILILGDPTKLEVVVDVLSTEAVRVKPGMPVILRNWGGDKTLTARVRTVEPYAFTKVSALGIEEQRVNIIADLIDQPQELGDGFKVDVGIVIWENPNALKIPVSSLFRVGPKWAVFLVANGRARKQVIEIGHRSSDEAEVRGGIAEGMEVVIHPPSTLNDGSQVKR